MESSITSGLPTFPVLGIFGVHYGDPRFLLDIPLPSEAAAPDGYRFNNEDFRRPLWLDPKFPYLVLLPRFSPFYGPLFSRLNVNEKTVPIVEVTVPGSSFKQFDVRWGLEQKLVDSWLYLESLPRLTLRTMMDLYGSRPAEAVYTFLSPINYCYTERNATSRSNAVKIALRSRDAFLPLMAEITLMFILLDARDIKDWRGRLKDHTKLNWQWIVDLEQSAVGNMTIDRMGGLMDLTLAKTHLDHHLPRHARWLLPHLLGKHRVPLYFFYGNDLPLKEPIPDALVNLGFVPSQNGEVVFSRWSTTGPSAGQGAGARDALCSTPIFHSLSRQDIHAFMQRRRLHNEKRAKHESADAKKGRLAREHHASAGAAPGKKGARVFIWEEEGGGFFIRRACNRTNAADRWDEFTDHQRWDLCTALAPNEVAEPDIVVDDDDDDDFFFHRPAESTDVLPALPDVPGRDVLEGETGERAAQVLEHAYGLSREDLCEDPTRLPGWQPQEIRSIVASRFGFIENSTAPASRRMQDKAGGWAIGDETWSVPSASSLPALLQHILDASDLKAIPANLMDIVSSDSDLDREWNVHVKILKQHERVLYELFPSGSHSSSPSIFLESAAAVLQCLRSGWGNNSDVETIIRNLVKLGAAFNPGWLRPVDYAPLVPPTQPTLGRRHAGYIPTLVDFGVYVERRNSFLRSPRGRVALFYGGIVGRLARLVLSDFEDLACYDPSEENLRSGTRVEGSRGGEIVLWHEQLTENEIDIICGVYTVETGA
ncbi:hypothetical protein R3P38DRAFT_3332056 [Favolaschia claudopus]|uniref:Uncharacterized protein n=1 Tax=Favolaschia claudopus TaxID=2862362 RepID=A0AAV9ZPB3_9AGAR